MTNVTETTAQDSFPYAYAVPDLDKALSEIRQGARPSKMDNAFFTRAGVKTPPGVLRAFREFGFIDETNGFLPLGEKLRTPTGTHEAALAALETCYPHLWERAQNATFTLKDLDEYIAGHMDQAESARANARRTFLWLVRQSGNEHVAKRLEHSKGVSVDKSIAERKQRKDPATTRGDSSSSTSNGEVDSLAGQVNRAEGRGALSKGPLDRFGVLAQVLSVNIDSSSSPELVREVRELLVTLLGIDDTGERDADT